MSNLIVIGTQWGDEGKGKIVDLLSSEADTIVRFQGGHNAGHTLVVGDKIFKLSLLPSGIIRENKIVVIGNGVVLDPWKLLEEIEQLSSRGIKICSERLIISENTPLILPFHKDLDLLREKRAGKEKIGTTGRGIGPAYEDKVGRRALRTGDLQNADEIKRKLKNMKVHHDILRAGLGAPDIDEKQLFNELMLVREKIKIFIKPVWKILNKQVKKNQNILFEGAQGSMLDVDFGTYPFVTSSSTIAAAAAIGSGVAHNKIKSVLGITKAYTTRVGSGPFPTELKNKIGESLGKRGKEFGTVTARKRRCGWFDGVLVRQTIKISGIDGIALTKLDVLDDLEEVKICVQYDLNGKKMDYLPAASEDQFKIKPIYKTFPGWKTNTQGIRNMKDLPENAKRYIYALEDFIGAKVSSISTSPERDDTILIEDPFKV